MKIVDKEMFEIAQVYAIDAVNNKSEWSWMCAREYLKLAYGL